MINNAVDNLRGSDGSEAVQRSAVEIQPYEMKPEQVMSCDTLFCQKSFNPLFSIVAMGLWSNTAILCYTSYWDVVTWLTSIEFAVKKNKIKSLTSAHSLLCLCLQEFLFLWQKMTVDGHKKKKSLVKLRAGRAKQWAETVELAGKRRVIQTCSPYARQ